MSPKARIFAALANAALLVTIFCAFQVQQDGTQIWWAIGLGISAWLTVRWVIAAAALYTQEQLEKEISR